MTYSFFLCSPAPKFGVQGFRLTHEHCKKKLDITSHHVRSHTVSWAVNPAATHAAALDTAVPITQYTGPERRTGHLTVNHAGHSTVSLCNHRRAPTSPSPLLGFVVHPRHPHRRWNFSSPAPSLTPVLSCYGFGGLY